jgi:hypothetical protein
MDLANIQYKRDGEGPDLYCYFNEFHSHLPFDRLWVDQPQYAKLAYRTWLAYLPSGIKSSSSYTMFKAKPDEYYVNKLNSDILHERAQARTWKIFSVKYRCNNISCSSKFVCFMLLFLRNFYAVYELCSVPCYILRCMHMQVYNNNIHRNEVHLNISW